MPAELTLTVNGETRRMCAGDTIADLVASLDLNPLKVAVERNDEIVPRSTLAQACWPTATCWRSCISSAAGMGTR